MVSFDALIQGRFTEELSDRSIIVPKGRCEVLPRDGFVTIGWLTDGESVSVALPVERFERLLMAGTIVIVSSSHRPQLAN